MRLLLDSHIFLAVQAEGSVELDGNMRVAISKALPNVFVSTASLWEIAIKYRSRRLKLQQRLEELPTICDTLSLQILAIEWRHVLCELDSVPTTKDPFDRLLLAQAQVEDMRLMTIDRALNDHPLAWRAK